MTYPNKGSENNAWPGRRTQWFIFQHQRGRPFPLWNKLLPLHKKTYFPPGRFGTFLVNVGCVYGSLDIHRIYGNQSTHRLSLENVASRRGSWGPRPRCNRPSAGPWGNRPGCCWACVYATWNTKSVIWNQFFGFSHQLKQASACSRHMSAIYASPCSCSRRRYLSFDNNIHFEDSSKQSRALKDNSTLPVGVRLIASICLDSLPNNSAW